MQGLIRTYGLITDNLAVNAQSAQVTLKRLDLAFKAFFRRIKACEEPGFPRFKAKDRWR